MPQPQDSQNQVEGELDQVGRPPRAGEDGDGDDQRADRGADTVGTVQQVQQPPPAGQGHRGIQPGVHHAGRHARQRRHGEHQPQPGGQREPGVAQRRDRAGHGEQGRHAQAPHQRADERGDQHGPGRGEEQDQTEVTDRRAEGGAHRRPRGAEHAIGEPEDDEAAEAEQIGTPAGRGRPMLLTHWSMYTQRPADRVNRAQLVPPPPPPPLSPLPSPPSSSSPSLPLPLSLPSPLSSLPPPPPSPPPLPPLPPPSLSPSLLPQPPFPPHPSPAGTFGPQ